MWSRDYLEPGPLLSTLHTNIHSVFFQAHVEHLGIKFCSRPRGNKGKQNGKPLLVPNSFHSGGKEQRIKLEKESVHFVWIVSIRTKNNKHEAGNETESWALGERSRFQ